MVVDETLIEAFERDGAVTVRGLIGDEWI